MSRPIASSDPFGAVADPTRRRIVDLLRQREQSVSELVTEFRISLSAVSGHLRILREAGVIQQRSEGTRRIYSLKRESLAPVVKWALRHRGR